MNEKELVEERKRYLNSFTVTIGKTSFGHPAIKWTRGKDKNQFQIGFNIDEAEKFVKNGLKNELER